MPLIHIEHPHTLGWPRARQTALDWGAQAQEQWGLRCRQEEKNATELLVHFEHPGVHGTLQATATQFVLHATLGFVLGAFQAKIQAAIQEQLNALAAPSG